MQYNRQARLFISHRHMYDNDYGNLKRRIEGRGIEHRDSTWFAGKRVNEMSEEELGIGLRNAIAWCNIFVVVARMASAHGPGWCKWEVATADALGKPILAYRPRNTLRVPQFISKAENYIAEFTRVDRLDSILQAILG